MLQPLRIIATHYDDCWHRQHFKGVNTKSNYCAVDGQIYTFVGEPECPIRPDVEIIEVDKDGGILKVWQAAQ